MQHVRTGKSLLTGVDRALAALMLAFCAAGSLAAAEPDRQYALAAAHYQQSRWPLAVAEFETFLAEFPQHPLAGDARFFAAEASIQEGRYDAAARRLDAFLADHANHRFAPQAAFRRGECDYFQRRNSAARSGFESFVKQYPRHELLEFALPYLGELCLTAGDVSQAETHYQQALRNYPAGRMADQCRFGLAQALEAQGETEAAERFYRHLAASRQRPLWGEAGLRLAALLSKQSRHEEAVGPLEQVLAEPSQAAWHRQASFLLLKARHAQRRWSDVTAIYQRSPWGEADAAETDDASQRAAAAFLTAEAEQRQGNHAAARRLYRRAVEQHTERRLRSDSLAALFALEIERQDAAAAGQVLAELAAGEADYPRLAQLQRVWIANRLGEARYDEAEQYLRELPPPQREALGAEADYFTALIALSRREYAEALALLEELAAAELPADTSASVQVARATALVNLQRYAEAIAPLEDYLARNPTGAEASLCREYLLAALAREGHWSRAAEVHDAMRRESASGGGYLRATLQFARLALAAEQHELARPLYEEVAAAGDDAPEGIVAEALAALASLEQGGDSRLASPALARLLNEFPDSPLGCTALLESARRWAAAGQTTKALAQYHALLDRFPDQPTAAEALLAAALLYDRLDQHAEAEALWRLLLAHRHGAELADAALYNLAWSLQQLQRDDEARQMLQRLAEQHRDSRYWPDTMLRLARREHQQQRQAAARGRLEELLRAEPEPIIAAHARYLLGTLSATENKWEQAAECMQQVLAAGVDERLTRPAGYWLAEAHYQRRNYQAAETRFAALASETPDSQEPWEAMIPLRQAQCLAYRKQWAAAEELAATLAERFPQFPQQYEADYLLGRCLAAQARFDEARAAYRRAIASPLAAGTETEAMASWMIGETHFHQRQYVEALRAYYRTAEFSNHGLWKAAALLQAAKCHEVQGQWDKAALRYDDILAISPTTRFHAEAGERRREAIRRRDLAKTDSSTQTR